MSSSCRYRGLYSVERCPCKKPMRCRYAASPPGMVYIQGAGRSSALMSQLSMAPCRGSCATECNVHWPGAMVRLGCYHIDDVPNLAISNNPRKRPTCDRSDRTGALLCGFWSCCFSNC